MSGKISRPLRAALVALAVAAATLSIAGISLAAGATVSGAVYQPDGRISLPCHKELVDCQPEWFGDDIYNTTASGQKAVFADYPNFYDVDPVVFKIKIQNDGNRVEGFRVVATGKTAGYKVKFFAGTTDVTAAVRAGTFRTPPLAPGEKYLLRAKVNPVDPSGNDKTVRLVTLTSLADSTKQDAVKLVRFYYPFTCGC